MTKEEFAAWDRDLIAALEAGDDSAARDSLAAGVPIDYREDDTPDPGVIREYPDGGKQLVTFMDGKEVFLRDLRWRKTGLNERESLSGLSSLTTQAREFRILRIRRGAVSRTSGLKLPAWALGASPSNLR